MTVGVVCVTVVVRAAVDETVTVMAGRSTTTVRETTVVVLPVGVAVVMCDRRRHDLRLRRAAR